MHNSVVLQAQINNQIVIVLVKGGAETMHFELPPKKYRD